MNPATGTLAKQYRVLSKLGEGGMAHVYLAMSQGLAGFSKLVVLKILKQELATKPELRDGFLREARVSARMGHPNVVAVNAVEEHEGVPVIVMEYLQGQPLSAIQRRLQAVPLYIQLRILSDSLSGLHYAHELADFDGKKLNLVHRDFTPQNIFVTFDGSVKVLDFGIAQVTRQSSDLRRDVVKGKLRYMAPEQMMAAPLDRRTDVFAAGIMLCEAATHRRFWGELADSEVVKRVLSGAIPAPSSIDPACPYELDAMCRKALAFDRNERYGTVAELQQELEAFISSKLKRVSSQELGRQLSLWFEKEQKDAVDVIESTLSDERYVSWSSISVARPESNRSNTPPAAVAQAILPNTAQADTAGKSRRRRITWVMQVVVIAALSIGISSYFRAVKLQPSALPPTVVPVFAVSITAFPTTAQLFIDGVPAGRNPFTQNIRAGDASWHVVRAQAPGFRAVEQRHQFNRNIDLVLALETEDPVNVGTATTSNLEVRPSARVLKAATASVVAPNKRAPKVKPPSCSPPFTYDAQGLKHFKPECM
ncbi:MAG TPA: serine/threonine-protein kinase [Polyangiaceae bacterium]